MSGGGNGDEKSPLDLQDLTVGFVGCGTIATAIARGLALAANGNKKNVGDDDDDDDEGRTAIGIRSMFVSERSVSKSTVLKDELSSSVEISIAANNQAILDACDLIFLTVLPGQVGRVLEGLSFDPNRHVLVSLVSTASLPDLVRESGLDPARVAKMICLPSIATHTGVALLCCGGRGVGGNGKNEADGNDPPAAAPTRQALSDLFGATGGVVCLDTEADLEACMVTTCTMGPLYGTMRNQKEWLLDRTESLSPAAAEALVIRQFAGAVGDAARASKSLDELIAEQTPGGLNEQALFNYGTVLGGFASVEDPVMDATLSRIRGETDGSLVGRDTDAS